MINTRRALLKAVSSSVLKKPPEIDEYLIQSLNNIELIDKRFIIDYAHYARYVFQVDWPEEFLHPCYLQMITLPMQLQLLSLPECPVKPVGLVHIHNRIVQQPFLEKGQPFSISVKFGDLRKHPKGISIDVIVLLLQKDKEVYRAIGTYLKRSQTIPELLDDPNEKLPYLRPDTGLARRYLTDLLFKRFDAREYARLSGDYNLIHLSVLGAKLFGFKSSIIHGMASLAMTLSAEEKALRFNESDLPLEVDCDFLKPIYLPTKTQIMTGCINVDRFVSLHAKDDLDTVHLLIRYARGEATRLYSGRI